MAGVAPALSSGAAAQPHGAGSLKWQRARLVLDQHQRGTAAAPDKAERVLPVRAELADLLPPHGLRRGSTVVVRGSTTVLLALLAEATAGGSWAAVVGMPDLGVLAAAELGVAIPRLALIPHPGADYPDVVAALLDGIDLVGVATPGQAVARRPDLARRLSARARHRESVLLVFGTWPGADLELDCAETTWSGLGKGYGHLTTREITVTVRGRGAASRPTSSRITLPNALTPHTKPCQSTSPLRVVGPTELPGSARFPTSADLVELAGAPGFLGWSGVVDPAGFDAGRRLPAVEAG